METYSEKFICMSFLLTYLDLPRINPDSPEYEYEALLRVLSVWDCLWTYGRHALRSMPVKEQTDIVMTSYNNICSNGKHRVQEFRSTDDYKIVKIHWDLIWALYKAGW